MTTCKLIFSLSFIIFSFSLNAQEICDNAIDDDGDGLIDFNDNDCICQNYLPTSLIPNPSFEDMNCCPEFNDMMECASEWIQASGTTSDYINLCSDFTGNTNIFAVAPLPLIDGDGAVGFRDGNSDIGPSYKEYVGACLTEQLVIGEIYRLDFYIGFMDNVPGSLNLDIAIFGTDSCVDLPFHLNNNSNNNSNNGAKCPSDNPEYQILGQASVSGNNEWVNVIIDFDPTSAYEVIVVGPVCDNNSQYELDPYFYLDRLILEKLIEFEAPLEKEGKICENDLVLRVEGDSLSTYQWYKDGIAIIGETDFSITLSSLNSDVEGTYMAIIFSDGLCIKSKEYDVRVPPYYTPIDALICESDSYNIGTEMIDQAGYYEITLAAQDGCDSIIQLNLDVSPTTYSEIDAYLCVGETYTLYDVTTTEAGNYEANTINERGCDSIISINLQLFGSSFGVEIQDEYVIDLGTTVDIIPVSIDSVLTDFSWTDANGVLLGEMSTLSNFQPSTTTTIYLHAKGDFGCTITNSVLVRVNKDNINIYIPNIFTPNNDNINDEFRFFPSKALDEIKTFVIYDRWGNQVYEALNFRDFENTFWDGNHNGQQVVSGVYAYYIEAKFLDGTEQILKGTITLVR